jgi:crotonobetainyl-CoA:carnitine CoA-transferase CaiB-like acyl-CoA transferase
MVLHEAKLEPTATGPLDGIRVLDLSRIVAGNMLSMQLADFGAEVIKIEDPDGGDPLRDVRVKGISVYWKVYARNKKSVAVDLRKDEGRKLLLALLDTAHVLVENFRPGTLEDMDLAPDALHARNPGLVIVRISGFGQDGPYRTRPGLGTLAEAMSGFGAKNGYVGEPPLLPSVPLADMVAGLYGSSAVLMALRHREVRSGGGQTIDLPLLDPLLSILGPEAAVYRLTGKVSARTGSRSDAVGPRNVFRTLDNRWIALSTSTQAMAERLFRTIGRPEMINDPRFRTNSQRVANADACEAPVANFISERTLAEVMNTFEAADVAAAPVYEVDQLIADPHVIAREIMVEFPDEQMGTLPMHAIVPRLSDTPGRYSRPAPKLGEHTVEVLTQVGYDTARVEQLARSGVIRLVES